MKTKSIQELLTLQAELQFSLKGATIQATRIALLQSLKKVNDELRERLAVQAHKQSKEDSQ